MAKTGGWGVQGAPVEDPRLGCLRGDERQIVDIVWRRLEEERRGERGDGWTLGPDDDTAIRQVIAAEVRAHNLRAAGSREGARLLPAGSEVRIFDHLRRLGPLQPLIDDARVEEIQINGCSDVFVVYQDWPHKVRVQRTLFEDDEDVIALLKRAIRPSGRQLDTAHPIVNARLADGSRLSAVLPPVSDRGPTVAIRKYLLKDVRLEQLVEREVLPADAADDLERALRGGVSILISGPTGSGKSTLLKALAATLIGPDERIVTIEETLELDLGAVLENAPALEYRPPNVDGKGEVTLRELVRNAWRLRPTRIILGEMRGPEALDVILALTSGHDGSLSTIHASDARAALEKMIMLASIADVSFSQRMLTRAVAEAIGLAVHVDYCGPARRRGVTEIVEVAGTVDIGGEAQIQTNPLWAWSSGEGLVQVGQPGRTVRQMARHGVAYRPRRLSTRRAAEVAD